MDILPEIMQPEVSVSWNTRVTELLGSKYPIIQGAFGGFGRSDLSAPVSAAGGFGIITASALRTPERLREDIRKARSITDAPFGINLSIGLCPSVDEMREVAIEERVPVVFTSAYRADNHGKRIQEAGLKWVHKVASVQHALAAERQGADAVVIVGLEGTAFKSIHQLPTLVSITTAVRQMRIPIIAAGGIGDARGFLAALAMGAEGIYMGTRFLATDECPVSDKHKQALVEAQPWDEDYRERALTPPNPEEYEKLLGKREDMPMDQWLQHLEQVMFKRSPEGEIDWDSGIDVEVALRIAGGSLAVGVINSVMPVKDLINSITAEAEDMLSKAGDLGKLIERG
jgi:NAD(P)H-dependent flavin oxidoreductase YrpB (nitropropane dioxygenase family)